MESEKVNPAEIKKGGTSTLGWLNESPKQLMMV